MIERQIIVIAWLVASMMAAAIQVLLILDEYRGLRALKRDGLNGAARLVCHHDMRTDAMGLLVSLIIFGTGIVAFTVVNRGNPPFSAWEAWAVEHFWRVLGYGVLSSTVMLVIKGVWKRYDRNQLIAAVTRMEKP